jgi:hypothetical protein
MARETIVPPWSRKHWASIMGEFNEFRILENRIGRITNKKPPPPPPVGLNVCKPRGGTEYVRFSFTHQVYEKLSAERAQEFKKTIVECIDGVNKKSQTPVLYIYRDKLLDGSEFKNISDAEKTPKAKELYKFDADRALRSLAGLPGLVQIESIFLSMNCVVTVCTIHPDDIPTVHAKVVGWAKEIVNAQKVKLAGSTKLTRVVTAAH